MNFGRCLPKRAERRECVNAKDECLLAGVGPPDGKQIKMTKDEETGRMEVSTAASCIH